MGVHIADLVRIHFSIRECGLHRCYSPSDGGRGKVARVGTHPDPQKLTVDRRTSRMGRVEGFEDHHRGALAEHHAGTIHRERAARVCGYNAERFPGAEVGIAERSLAPSCHRGVGKAVAQHPKCLPDGMTGRRARRRDRERWSVQAEVHRDRARVRTPHRPRNRQRSDTGPALLVQRPEDVVVEGILTGCAGSGDHACPSPNLLA